MERLTARDKKGQAYFDDDGALIRGVNGTFHQKKDMTNQFIHQRFVALDKVIDCLATYEDIGLTPEEIMMRITPQLNTPLTQEELRKMIGEPVFIKYIRGNRQGAWKIIHHVTDRQVDFTDKTSHYLPDSSPAVPCYGRTWLAYRHKPEEA